MGATFKDNTAHCEGLIKDAGLKWLEEAAAEVESQTMRNSRVKTGQTKGSYQHVVDESSMTSFVGSDQENAIWEEFGTGEYALHGDGRKGGWFYVDAEGNGHYTTGKTPNQPMDRAFTSLKSKLQQRCEDIMKGLT